MRRRGLRTAIAKLEAKARLKRFAVPIVFALYPEENPGHIIGLVKADGTSVDRLWQDDRLEGFATRASMVLGARIMYARYAVPEQPEAPLEPVAAPVAHPDPPESARVNDYFQSVWLGN